MSKWLVSHGPSPLNRVTAEAALHAYFRIDLLAMILIVPHIYIRGSPETRACVAVIFIGAHMNYLHYISVFKALGKGARYFTGCPE